MKQLWAPWRIEYILMEKPKECIFCVKPRENNDERNLILYRGRYCFIILNLFPYNNGHLMIAPYRHVSSIEDMNNNEIFEMGLLTRASIKLLRKTLNPDGFNVGFNIGRAAGAGIEEHVHMHIVPRWHGDTNFMPVLGNTKVIPEALKETYSKLKANIEVINRELGVQKEQEDR